MRLRRNVNLSFFYQARPNFPPGFLYTNGKFNIFEDDSVQFWWKVIEHERGFLRINCFPPPSSPLAWDVSSTDYLDIWVDEKECDNLAVAWFRGVRQLKRTHAVLKDEVAES